jgi:VTC domain
MYTSATAEGWFAGGLASLGLDELNAKAAMLERLDNKYIVPGTILRESLEYLAQAFDVLEIEGKRAFTYDTRYFDGPSVESYHFHHQGRRRRCKVRIRNYVDAALSYIEVKLKDKRGSTVKMRKRCTPARYDGMPAELAEFVNTCHRDLYGDPLPYELGPSLDMSYRRITLVARDGGERMTIDGGISFARGGERRAIDDGLFIVETKSRNGNGLADRVFRRLHRHPANRCSKYCVGLAMTEAGIRCNKFRFTLARLGWTK